MTANYLNLRINAPRRLAILRENAAQMKYATFQDWRKVRYARFDSTYQGLTESYSEGMSSWCSDQSGEMFSREKYADDIDGARIDHTGWYADSDGDEKVRGIVVALPHGRFIAGYETSCNDERVYFSTLYTDAVEAARAADSEAESTADSEREYQDKYRAAQTLDEETDEALDRLRECLALRNHSCFERVRDEARELIETIKGNRARLAGEFNGML